MLVSRFDRNTLVALVIIDVLTHAHAYIYNIIL